MIGERDILKDYQSVSKGHVSFGDGVKGRVLKKWTLDVDGLPRLKIVLYVEWPKANLISISQLYDQNMIVKFTKNTCKVFNKSENVFWKDIDLLIIVINCYNLTHVTRPSLIK